MALLGCSFLLILLILTVRTVCLYARNNDQCERTGLNVTHAQCDFKEHDHRLVCFGGIEDKWRSGGEKVRALVLCDWPEESLDPQDTLQGFGFLRKLVIANGNLTKLTSTFSPGNRSLEELVINGTRLRELPEHVFANLTGLKTLALRNNDIEEINVNALDTPSSLRHIYLSGNPLRCTDRIEWILDTGRGSIARKIADREKLRCGPPHEGRPLVPVVEIIQALKGECTRTVCDCELVYVVSLAQKQLMAFATVNCSHRGLTEMPSFLPANTTTLRLTGNKIMDLSPLTKNPSYDGVIDIYLDDNMVESIVQLDGSRWLDHFRLLSLRGNKLTDLPTYALENALHQSGSAASLYLGKNPWTCDCLFTPGFQELLNRYPNLVKDIDDVKCAVVKGDENSGKHIRDLTRTEICIPADGEPWLHPLDVLNIILASLIILILGKLLYDYWSFKKTGKLPWIVARIP